MPKEYRTVKEFNSDEYIVKRSRFIGYAKPVTTVEEANAFIAEIKAKRDEIASQIADLEDGDFRISELEKQLADAEDKAYALAREITAKRQAAAERLSAEIVESLKFLDMPKVVFFADIKEEITEIKIDEKAMIPKEDVVVMVTKDGYIKRTSFRSYTASNPEDLTLKDLISIVARNLKETGYFYLVHRYTRLNDINIIS